MRSGGERDVQSALDATIDRGSESGWTIASRVVTLSDADEQEEGVDGK